MGNLVTTVSDPETRGQWEVAARSQAGMGLWLRVEQTKYQFMYMTLAARNMASYGISVKQYEIYRDGERVHRESLVRPALLRPGDRVEIQFLSPVFRRI